MIIKYFLAFAVVSASVFLGAHIENIQWHKRLIESDMAEYHSKTGEWRLRTITEIVDAGLILGKGTPIKVGEKN
jgi:hypothetical protein